MKMHNDRVRGLVALVALTGFACDSKPPAKAETKPAPTAKRETKDATDEPALESAKPLPAKPLPAKPVTFTAADGSTVHADYYGFEGPAAQAVVVLFHQAGWNAGEYEAIAPRLQSLGYASLAPDQRSGGTVAGRENRYVGGKDTVAGSAKQVDAPLFVTSATGDEVEAAKTIFQVSPSTRKEQHVPAKGVHGSSILREDKNPGGTAPVWTAVEAFLGSTLTVQ